MWGGPECEREERGLCSLLVIAQIFQDKYALRPTKVVILYKEISPSDLHFQKLLEFSRIQMFESIENYEQEKSSVFLDRHR